jgi:hypothetical protein
VTFTDGTNPAGTLPTDPGASADRTLGNWDKVSGVNSSAGYGICTLSYVLAFDDNAKAFNTSNGFTNATLEEQMARTEVDYLGAVLSDNGQTAAATQDYDVLPANILTVSRTGLAAIGFDKAGGGGGGGDCPSGTHGTPPNCVPDGGGGCPSGTHGTPPNCVPNGGGPGGKPSNQFTIGSTLSQSNGNIKVAVIIPGKGRIKVVPTVKVPFKLLGQNKSGKKTISYGASRTIVAFAGGTVRLVIKPSSTVKNILALGKTLHVDLKITFTPTKPPGNVPRTKHKTVTVKGKKKVSH